ncbi:MAG TPA: GspH/FimT family pseudopilin [Longimicrobium sp.]|nr:GspH/FimT family pseudopilin [Longimicrobium sp.]
MGADRRGFTLAEVLVVLVIVGILYTLGQPRMERWTRHARVRAAANQLACDLAYARHAAVQRGGRVELRLDPSADCPPQRGGRVAGHVYRIGPRGGETARRVDLRHGGGRLCLEMNQSAAVAFNSRGLLPGFTNRTLWVSEAGVRDSLTLSAVGRVLRRF